MEHSRLLKRLCEFGGLRLLREYGRLGLLRLCFKEVFFIFTKHKRPIDAYGTVMECVAERLRKRYEPYLEIDGYYDRHIGSHSKKVWVCWLQGIDAAPELVKVCYESLHRNLKGREIILLTNENVRQYVTLPKDIEKKYRDGIIPMAHYTDMLRLDLLIKYGGTWIDATVLCTEPNTDSTNLTDMLDSDLFLFQQLRKDETRFLGISNWFITTSADNWVLKVLRDMLYQYWRDYNCVVHYYMFHLFFGMIMEKYPEVAAKMPRHGNKIPHYLQRRMGDKYDDEWMQELKKRACFHKLSYRLSDEIVESKGTFYDVVIKHGLMN